MKRQILNLNFVNNSIGFPGEPGFKLKLFVSLSKHLLTVSTDVGS